MTDPRKDSQFENKITDRVGDLGIEFNRARQAARAVAEPITAVATAVIENTSLEVMKEAGEAFVQIAQSADVALNEVSESAVRQLNNIGCSVELQIGNLIGSLEGKLAKLDDVARDLSNQTRYIGSLGHAFEDVLERFQKQAAAISLEDLSQDGYEFTGKNGLTYVVSLKRSNAVVEPKKVDPFDAPNGGQRAGAEAFYGASDSGAAGSAQPATAEASVVS